MDEKVIELFEKEFYGFVKSVINNPPSLKQKTAELKRILNRLLAIKNSADLEKIVQGLRESGLFKSQIYHHASAVIQEVEKNLYAAIANRSLQNINYQPSNNVNKVKTSDKKAKEMMDYLRS